MYDFILQLFLVSSLGVIVYMMARALPRVADEIESPVTFYDYMERWLEKLPIHHLDQKINHSLFKFLKRIRVIIMKLDNNIVHGLGKLKKNGENSNGNGIHDLLKSVDNDKKE